jgi:type 1 glutamine amidotransferase
LFFAHSWENSMKRALVVWGGLELHEPEAGAVIVRQMLEGDGFAVTVTGDYAALGAADVGSYDLIVPQISGGELDDETTRVFCAAIAAGTGLAAFHHGLATSFKGNNRFRFMAACTFAAHPGDVISYTVDPVRTADPVMAGIASFVHTSEQYYMPVDPAVEVLATTTFSGEHAFWKRGVQNRLWQRAPVLHRPRPQAGRTAKARDCHHPASGAAMGGALIEPRPGRAPS